MRYIFFRPFLNFIGAITRWFIGAIWRSIFNKPKYTFGEYLSGPKNSTAYFDVYGHKFNNMLVGSIVLVIIFAIIIRISGS